MLIVRCPCPLIAGTLALAAAAGTAPLSAQPVARVSLSSTSAEPDWDSTQPAISANGRFTAFVSGAFNLAPGGTPDATDVYVRDLVTGQTTVVSVSSAGVRGDAASDSCGISADGRYVVFRSYATNLVPNDANGVEDVFLRDRLLGTTVLVSATPAGASANGPSDAPVISADASTVAYETLGTDIVSGTPAGIRTILLWSRATGQTAIASHAPDGSAANGDSLFPTLSADGRYVAYESAASNLVAGDTNGSTDVFVRDRLSGAIARASVSSSGAEAATDCDEAAISADGNWVAFRSHATNLAPDPDTNDQPDVFLHNRFTGSTILVSIGTDGSAALGDSHTPSVSANGRYVAFHSRATNIVAGDSNVWGNVYLRDTVAGHSTRLSNGSFWSLHPGITPSGAYVGFDSYADNIVTGDANQVSDVYMAGPLASAYTLFEAGRALEIAGGLLPADAMDLPRLDAVSDAHVNLLDAVRIARRAVGLEP